MSFLTPKFPDTNIPWKTFIYLTFDNRWAIWVNTGSWVEYKETPGDAQIYWILYHLVGEMFLIIFRTTPFHSSLVLLKTNFWFSTYSVLPTSVFLLMLFILSALSLHLCLSKSYFHEAFFDFSRLNHFLFP